LLPGIMTPTEVIAARQAGFDTLKLFPAQHAGGAGMLRALSVLFPDVWFCPTGGVTRANAQEYLTLPSVICVSGSWVAPQDLVQKGDWQGIEAFAREAAVFKRTLSQTG
jgi:2-dehydro-3-deoxyphosphogluconate aldolase / (4S)-4-hydroxy-2-oxoglutarate aldolase